MLNPNEKIDSWEIVFTTKVDKHTATHIPGHLRSRKLTATELDIDIPDTASSLIDEEVKKKYPVTW